MDFDVKNINTLDGVWFISDTHFFHKNVIEYENRPFKDQHEMNKVLIKRWNDLVKPEHTVYFLGDFSFAGIQATRELCEKLNGYKIAIFGNHDGSKTRLIRMGFDEAHDRLKLILPDDREVLLTHYPYHPGEAFVDKLRKAGKPEHTLKSFKWNPIDEGKWLIHGHVHGNWKFKSRMINVGVENWNYQPVAAKELVKHMKDNPKGTRKILADGQEDRD